MPLFTKLQACKFSVIGTTRPYKELFTRFKVLKIQFTIKFKWNTLLIKVVNNTLYLAWQDNNIVLALSNIYIVYTIKDFHEKVKRRLVKILTNGRIV